VFAHFLREQVLTLAGGQPTAAHGALIVISGMASSSVGWCELPYSSTPLDLDGGGLVHETLLLQLDPRCHARVLLLSGLRANNDIMRGEETEILGLFAEGQHSNIAAKGLVVLPGSHSKHVYLEQRRITDFRTYMTGELFDVLSTQSLLRASVQPASDTASFSDGASREAFLEGVRESAARGLAASLFQTRVRTVLHGVPAGVNRWFLSGLLIGAEMAELNRHMSEAPLLLAACEPLVSAYALALEELGCSPRLTVALGEEIQFASSRGQRAILQSLNLTWPDS
jgi:2-dehydro-3-deoxygalactonokinase